MTYLDALRALVDLQNREYWEHMKHGGENQQAERECGLCGHTFTKSSMNLTVTIRKSETHLEKARVCGKCWNLHHQKGE